MGFDFEIHYKRGTSKYPTGWHTPCPENKWGEVELGAKVSSFGGHNQKRKCARMGYLMRSKTACWKGWLSHDFQ